MRAFVCDECGRVERDRYRQYRERLEVVRVDGRKRPHVETRRHLCQDCVDAMVAASSGAHPGQGSLL